MAATLVFDGTAVTNGTGGVSETFALTVASAAGQERFVFLAGISNGATADYYIVTIDGQTATRVGTLSAGVASNAAFITAYRAAGTANTSINVVATKGGPGGDDDVYSSYCACYKLSDADTLLATTNVSGTDPTLNTNTTTGGVAAAAVFGWGGDTGKSVAWSGLTEDFDGINVFGDDIFSGASAAVSSGATPRSISANISNDPTGSIASIAVSFNPASVEPAVNVSVNVDGLSLMAFAGSAVWPGDSDRQREGQMFEMGRWMGH